MGNVSGNFFKKLSRVTLIFVWMWAWFAPTLASANESTCEEVDGVIECTINVSTHGQGPELSFSIIEDQTQVTIVTYTSLTCDTFEQSAENGFADPYLYLYEVEPHPELEDTFSNTLVAQDDDSASHNDNTNYCWDATISTTLDIGDYIIRADSYDESTVGTYSIDITGGEWEISANEPEPTPEPTPEPEPTPVPDPDPTPDPIPDPTPTPDQIPEDDGGTQEPTPEPQPSPTPDPPIESTPTPLPEPDPLPEEEQVQDPEEGEQFEDIPQPEPEPLPEISAPTPPPFVIILPDDFEWEEELDEEEEFYFEDLDDIDWEEFELDELPEIDEEELLLLLEEEEGLNEFEEFDEEENEEFEILDEPETEQDFVELLPEEEEPEIILEEYFQPEDLEEIDFDEREAVEDVIEELGDEELAEDLIEILDEDITEEEISALVENDNFEDLPVKALDQVVQVVQEAPPEVRNVFEEEVNIFGGAVDDYVPTGSNITVEERRVVVAAVATTQAVAMASAKPTIQPQAGGSGSASGPSMRRRK